MAEEEQPAPAAEALTAGTLVRASVGAAVASLKDNEAGLRAGRDPDHVRKTRVALRRLRSNLRTFEDFVDQERIAPLVGELGALAAELGGVRDREVLAARLRDDARLLPAEDRAFARAIEAELEEEIRAARASATAFLDSPRFDSLMRALEELAADPPLTAAAARPAAEVIGPLARAPFERLRKAVRRLGKNPPDAELHRVRILAKRSRYAAQAVEPAAGEPAHRFAARAAELQTILGEHQDAVTAETWLAARELAGRPAFVAGLLAGLERAAAVAARGRWRAAWKELDEPGLRDWMEEPSLEARPGSSGSI